jgi:ABC-2 type transport system ATP-binding protein
LDTLYLSYNTSFGNWKNKDHYVNLRGPRGSGKTALCEILAGPCEPDDGELLVKDSPLYEKAVRRANIKRKIGYVPATCCYDRDMTAIEVMDMMGQVRRVDPDKRYRQIKEALSLTGLSQKTDTLIEDLSLSERKRLSIAASLIGNPDIIIMDEPFQYLDSKQASEIKSLLDMIKNKKVVLIFSARPVCIIEGNCSHVAILHGGELKLWTSMADMKERLEAIGGGSLAGVLEAFSAEDDGKGDEQ